MGLDMYLEAERYLSEYDEGSKKVSEAISNMFPEIGGRRIDTVSMKAMYWRKANQIHRWFVDNVQDGEDDCSKHSWVSREQLKELSDLCKKVMKASKLVTGKITNGFTYENGKKVPIMEKGKYIKDPTVAKELLPTSEGFFFGSTDYDEYYYNDLKETSEGIDKLLAEIPETWEFYYSSSW
jgi:hypothetical protein